jgi:D-alanyl-D-alanine-carboxypeptidase/D-alanyl-D-alanine-endopeptidase
MVGAGADPAGLCADTRATAGSGGMYSIAADMEAWMQYLLGVKTGSASAQRLIAQAIYVQRQALSSIEGLDIAGSTSGLGLGWVLLAPT